MDRKVKSVEIKNLWGRININWTDVFEDVNVIVGINGSGKSTTLKAMYTLLSNPNCDMSSFPFDYISIKIGDEEIRSDKNNNLKQPFLIETLNRDENSYDYIVNKLKLYKELEDIEHQNKRFEYFASIINQLFIKTKKTLDLTSDSTIQFRDSKQNIIKFEKLSLGEKQMLVFLYKVFLTREKPYILFLDEPELSLYVGWQSYLIDIIKKLNPNCQLFIVTHSPNIFSNGWGSRVVHIEDYFTEVE
ncbi:MAG: AAA family ATPase [Bacteroidales bacterium]|jgi:predicted ATP-dependent endonuclease of OLD family|nr:AAA family ATPase [Bacteroidales bacterium]